MLDILVEPKYFFMRLISCHIKIIYVEFFFIS